VNSFPEKAVSAAMPPPGSADSLLRNRPRTASQGTDGTFTRHEGGKEDAARSRMVDAGTHGITAVYNGDSNFGVSTASVLSQVVGRKRRENRCQFLFHPRKASEK
jgi:hypothetical protein